MTEASVYDAVPYPERAYKEAHPDRLAVIGLLEGLSPAPLEGCRILELGCATGANLLPIAYGLPGSECVGLDASAVQIETARQRAAELGLDNVRLVLADLAAVEPGSLGAFDYVIAHGVYSWVPAPARERLLGLLRAVLAPRGLGYVSYNTYPGWRITGIVRDLMRYHARNETDPRRRVSKARAILAEYAQIVPREWSGYAAVFTAHRDFLEHDYKGRHDGFLLHDELGEVNDPVYFHEFAAHARAHGLEWLAEATLEPSPEQQLGTEALDRIRALAADPIELEQYLDFLRNRMLRQSVLVHARSLHGRGDGGGGLERAALDRLVFASPLVAPADRDDLTSSGPARFQGPQGTVLETSDPATKCALAVLGSRFPEALALPALREAADAMLPEGAAPVPSRQLARNLLGIARQNPRLVHLHAFSPARLAASPSSRPRASAVARLEARTRSLVTTLWHDSLDLDPATRRLLPLFDGRRTPAEIAAALSPSGGPALEAGEIRERVRRLARSGLLEA